MAKRITLEAKPYKIPESGSELGLDFTNLLVITNIIKSLQNLAGSAVAEGQ